MDNQLPHILGRFLILFFRPHRPLTVGLTLAMVLGPVVIVSIIVPYFLIVVDVIGILFIHFGAFYRTSAREIKRLQSMLRSFLYAHFSETLTGLATIRSYGEMSHFIAGNRYYIDLEDRSLLLVIANQRWLSIRLDFMGNTLTFLVALLMVTDGSGINPAQIGLVLIDARYKISNPSQNDMNSIERSRTS
ncbi:hypothetical protein ID866_8414 [Astraeus odoratus]|nr:hypothetical protein ID866_8414 [Astraeus odoratus]